MAEIAKANDGYDLEVMSEQSWARLRPCLPMMAAHIIAIADLNGDGFRLLR